VERRRRSSEAKFGLPERTGFKNKNGREPHFIMICSLAGVFWRGSKCKRTRGPLLFRGVEFGKRRIFQRPRSQGLEGALVLRRRSPACPRDYRWKSGHAELVGLNGWCGDESVVCFVRFRTAVVFSSYIVVYSG
jgi:hypothetical protein